MSSKGTGGSIELEDLGQKANSIKSGDIATAEDTLSRAPSKSKKTKDSKKSKLFNKSWLLWWNSEEWWSCWIGLVFFGCIVGAVNHGIPPPAFLLWTTNPFSTFASPANYSLIVIFFAMGLLLWLALGMTGVAHWKRFPMGYVVVFSVALISKILANNGIVKQPNK